MEIFQDIQQELYYADEVLEKAIKPSILYTHKIKEFNIANEMASQRSSFTSLR